MKMGNGQIKDKKSMKQIFGNESTAANIGIANSGAGHWSNHQRQFSCTVVRGSMNKAPL
jgi:hypothetical protein